MLAGETTAPQLLTEADLLGLMAKYEIGANADTDTQRKTRADTHLLTPFPFLTFTAPSLVFFLPGVLSLLLLYGLSGTDATMAEHIQKIQDRQYVTLDATRHLTPTVLGIGLVNGSFTFGRCSEVQNNILDGYLPNKRTTADSRSRYVVTVFVAHGCNSTGSLWLLLSSLPFVLHLCA